MTTASWRSPSPRSANYCLMRTLDLMLMSTTTIFLIAVPVVSKLILLSVVFVLAEINKMIEMECHVMGKWINNVR